MPGAKRSRGTARKKKLSLASVRIVFFDFDGVFTNNQVVTLQDGSEGVLSNRSDGLGLKKLKDLGIAMVILSTEKNPVVRSRADKLGLPCHQALKDKLSMLQRLLSAKGISPAHAAYVGNDINDVACLQYVGFSVAVADAYPEAKNASRILLQRNGGYGAVREFCDAIAKAYAKTR